MVEMRTLTIDGNTFEVVDGSARTSITQLQSEVDNKQPIGNYITNETDPTVPNWAKEPTKPNYTAGEVGALPDTTKIPTKLSDLSNDIGYLTYVPSEYVTETELTNKGYAKQTDVNNLSSEINALKALVVDGNEVEY